MYWYPTWWYSEVRPLGDHCIWKRSWQCNPHDGISVLINGKLHKIFHCVRIQQDSGYLQKRKKTLTNKLITLQERILEWVVMLFSMASSRLSNWTYVSCVSCIAGGFFTHQAPWENHHKYMRWQIQICRKKIQSRKKYKACALESSKYGQYSGLYR